MTSGLDSGVCSKVYLWFMSISPAMATRRRLSPGLPASVPARPAAGVLRIGDLAATAGVSPDALRYYERRGLLQPTGRRASGYREYPPEAVGVVRFIKHAQALGFSLAEVEELLRLRGAPGRRSTGLEVREVAATKLRDIDEKLRMLGALRESLAELVAECDQTCGADVGAAVDPLDCPIIAALNAPNDAAPTPRASGGVVR